MVKKVFDIHELNDNELEDHLNHLKTSIKKYSMVNVAKPINYRETKQDYILELICKKYKVKKEIMKRHNIFKRLYYLLK